MARRLRARITPVGLLAVIAVTSLAARVAWLGDPCRAPCRTSADHLLIFDESYYVNAARVIAGIEPPAGARYAGAPLGDDPNSEHPQLAKVIVAGSIELFGDGPWAWRLGSLILGTAAILGMYGLARAAGGGPWLAVGAAGLMAFDNLLLVHGRIFTLDIYALAAMIWGAVLYLRGRPLGAGVVIGIGACCKLVAPYVLIVLVLFELLRAAVGGGDGAGRAGWARWRALLPGIASRLARVTGAAAVVFIALLAVLDRIAPPYDYALHRPVAGGPLHHLAHMLSYAAQQTSPHGPTGIASYPWGWLVDIQPIVYLNINPAQPEPGFIGVHPAVHFLGLISPPLMLVALPALAYAAWRARESVPGFAWAWFLGTFAPFVVLSLFFQRTSYLYYMVVVMPAIYLAVVYLVAAGWRRTGRWATRRQQLILVWGGALICAAVVCYPLTPLP